MGSGTARSAGGPSEALSVSICPGLSARSDFEHVLTVTKATLSRTRHGVDAAREAVPECRCRVFRWSTGEVNSLMRDVLELVESAVGHAPVVVDSPHSGEVSPADFGHAISEERLRVTVDAYVDELFNSAPDLGATFLKALFPRTYIDPNRSLQDIDEAMLDRPWPARLHPSPKVKQGIYCGLVR